MDARRTTPCGRPATVGPDERRAAFTLVELLVVMAVVALLLGVLVTVGGSTITSAKVRETRSVMAVLDQAIEQFKSDAPLKKVAAYKSRYGDYPCDELEAFWRDSEGGVPIPTLPGPVIGPGTSSDLNLGSSGTLYNIPNKDIKAMTLAIRLYSPEASAILDKIDQRYRKAPRDAEEYFDRSGNGELNMDDEPLVYFTDAWGVPLEYFSACRVPATPIAGTDDAQGSRLKTSSRFIHDNRGRAVLASYGPDGADQIEAAGLAPDDLSLLVQDYAGTDDTEQGKIDNPLNQDTVFFDETLIDRLRQEPAEVGSG